MTDDPVIKTRQSQRQHQALQTQQQNILDRFYSPISTTVLEGL